MWRGNTIDDMRQICSILNQCDRILAFNGGSFDIPFLQRVWRLSDLQVGLWMAKLVDPLYSVRGLFGTSMCEKLQSVLERNDMEGKSGSGAHAVELAKQQKWEELDAYCAQDTVQTWRLLIKKDYVWNEEIRRVDGQWSTQ